MKGDKTDPGQTMALFDPNKRKQKTIGEVILMGYLMVLKSYYIFLDVIMFMFSKRRCLLSCMLKYLWGHNIWNFPQNSM